MFISNIHIKTLKSWGLIIQEYTYCFDEIHFCFAEVEPGMDKLLEIFQTEMKKKKSGKNSHTAVQQALGLTCGI